MAVLEPRHLFLAHLLLMLAAVAAVLVLLVVQAAQVVAVLELLLQLEIRELPILAAGAVAVEQVVVTAVQAALAS